MTNKEAISNLNQIYGFVSSEIQQSLDLAIKSLEDRPQGEWKFDGWGTYCSECGHRPKIGGGKFCSECGAEMR